MASFCQMAFLAFSSVRSASICIVHDAHYKTISYHFILQVTVVTIAGKVVQCQEVLFCSFSLGLLLRVKQCMLKITFLLTEKLSNFSRTSVVSLVMPVEVKTLSDSSPKQYNKVLICCPSDLVPCSKHFLQQGHSSGV